MLRLIINWILSALSLLVVAHVIRGFEVTNFQAALIAALAIGLINATLGMILKLATLPLTLITFGVFWFVINAVMLKLVAAITPGFSIEGFLPAFFGAIVLSLVNLFMKIVARIISPRRRERREY
ncbi:MAG TPA: phage holin family protein [Terriglobia bacterium]|nr:phage holin family protein [Terriglobia bacterium]